MNPPSVFTTADYTTGNQPGFTNQESNLTGCYALVYHRTDADLAVSKDNLKLPPEEVIAPIRANVSVLEAVFLPIICILAR